MKQQKVIAAAAHFKNNLMKKYNHNKQALKVKYAQKKKRISDQKKIKMTLISSAEILIKSQQFIIETLKSQVSSQKNIIKQY